MIHLNVELALIRCNRAGLHYRLRVREGVSARDSHAASSPADFRVRINADLAPGEPSDRRALQSNHHDHWIDGKAYAPTEFREFYLGGKN